MLAAQLSWQLFRPADCTARRAMGQGGMSSPAAPPVSVLSAYLAGFRATWTSVFSYVLFGTYLGIGALAHDFGFTVTWALFSTVLVWAGPAQVILISTLGAGASLIEVAVAVGLSSVRLLPMVVAMLPMLRRPDVSSWKLLLPAHFTAVSMWVEAMRLLPKVPRENRVAFCNGLGTGYGITATSATLVGFYLAASLPPLMSAALLFLTPLAFLMSTLRNGRMLVDRLALGFGLVLGPLFAAWQVGLDLMWSGIAAGTAAYLAHRFREALR
jgi:predicted branched-subunit amino acid permease